MKSIRSWWSQKGKPFLAKNFVFAFEANGKMAVLATILGLTAILFGVTCLHLSRQLGRAEVKAELASMQRGSNEIYDALAELLDETPQPQPKATTVPSLADSSASDDNPLQMKAGSQEKTMSLHQSLAELEQRNNELKRACEVRDALLRTYEQREAGNVEAARAEFHRALQAANFHGGGEWYLEYRVSPTLWNLAAPRFKIFRDWKHGGGGLAAKEIRFASTK